MGSALYFIDCPNCGGNGCIDDEYKEGLKITDCMDCQYKLVEHYNVETGQPISKTETGKTI